MKNFSLMRMILFSILITIISWKYYSWDTKAKILNASTTDVSVAEISLKIDGTADSFCSWLRGSTNVNTVPSVSAGIVFNDKMVFHDGINANPDTRFGIASLTKTFTAILVLQLEEEGVISINDPVRKYLPGVIIERKEIGSSPVTIKHLLSHTSGMPGYGQEVKANINGKRVFHQKQRYPAGYNYSYSNKGYVILKYLIEAVTGASYAENLENRIFIPLEMTSSSGLYSNGTGGITTSLRDLAKYTSMLIQKGRWKNIRVISELSYHKMLLSAMEVPSTRSDYHYSLGWEVITVNNRVDSYYKAGRWYGSASGLQIFPEKRVAFIYLCNPPNHRSRHFMVWRKKLTGRLRVLLRNMIGDPKLCTQWPRITEGILKSYVGSYVNNQSGRVIKVIFRKKSLFCKRYGVLQKMKTFNSNRFLLGPRKLLNFVWRNNRVVGLAARDGYYRLERDL